MLKKVIQQHKQSLSLIKIAQRSLLTFQDKNYIVPEDLDEMIQYLDKKRPTFTLLYFTAKWNPMIPKIEKDYENTTKQFKQFEHIRVDCDQTPLVKQYFDARVEPQFLILLNGGELHRVVGFNFERLHKKLEETTALHYRDFTYWGETADTWERFYDNYDRFARTGEYDRDCFRTFYESGSDMHRGAGTV